jgi:hypothetical protein
VRFVRSIILHNTTGLEQSVNGKGVKREMRKGLISLVILSGFVLSMMMASGVLAKDVIEFNPKYGKVTFTHKKHVEALQNDCLKCHHTWKKGETSGKGCNDCHKAKAEGKTISGKDAFHKKCKGCHDEAKKANKPTGPTSCTKCHVKAKK